MAKVKFELDSNGVQQLLKGEAMQGILGQHASGMAARAGDGYASDVHIFTKRAVAHIYPETAEAGKDNLENNTLLKVVR